MTKEGGEPFFLLTVSQLTIHYGHGMAWHGVVWCSHAIISMQAPSCYTHVAAACAFTQRAPAHGFGGRLDDLPSCLGCAAGQHVFPLHTYFPLTMPSFPKPVLNLPACACVFYYHMFCENSDMEKEEGKDLKGGGGGGKKVGRRDGRLLSAAG